MQIPRVKDIFLAAALMAALAMSGCAPSTSKYVHPDMDFGHIRRCAVLPFLNLSSDSYADERMQTLFVMRVLEEKSIRIVEPGAVVAAMNALRLPIGGTLSPEQYVALGNELSVDGVFFGTIEAYGMVRENRKQVNQVTAVFGLAETETGVTVWQSQVHDTGSSFMRNLFGAGSRGIHDVSQSAIDSALGTLF